jgi:hypothetical protein
MAKMRFLLFVSVQFRNIQTEGKSREVKSKKIERFCKGAEKPEIPKKFSV